MRFSRLPRLLRQGRVDVGARAELRSLRRYGEVPARSERQEAAAMSWVGPYLIVAVFVATLATAEWLIGQVGR